MDVDLIVLSRDLSPLRTDVQAAIDAQRGVVLRLHRLAGARRPEDCHRWETICRARNRAKAMGSAPLVMCLDDDVVLGPECVARLVEALGRRPGFAALAADSAGEMADGMQDWDCPGHVGMAAALFRRAALARLTFRWEPGRCECLCCCFDLRRAGLGIGYHPGAIAWHRPYLAPRRAPAAPSATAPEAAPRPEPVAGDARRAATIPPRILSAFDRSHFGRFRRQFLPTLRDSGNDEPVSVAAYGLYPSELRRLEAAGVEVLARPDNGVTPAVRRVRDFQRLLERWPEETPVAFWDAGDVLFQASLAPLWDLVRAHPGRLLAVREPLEVGDHPAVDTWADPIRDPATREQVRTLLLTTPSINGGFAAGTAASLLRMLREVERLLNTRLRDVFEFGDQLAMQLYLHERPGTWLEVPDSWNYCLLFRDPRAYRHGPDGRLVTRDGAPVAVVHGNGRSLARRARAFV